MKTNNPATLNSARTLEVEVFLAKAHYFILFYRQKRCSIPAVIKKVQKRFISDITIDELDAYCLDKYNKLFKEQYPYPFGKYHVLSIMKHPDDLFISMCQNVTIDGLCFKYSCTRKDLEEFAIYHYGESLQNIYERSQKVVYSNLQARLYAFACSSDASPRYMDLILNQMRESMSKSSQENQTLQIEIIRKTTDH